ncbi:hypothetical protein [Azospirillum argentinense]
MFRGHSGKSVDATPFYFKTALQNQHRRIFIFNNGSSLWQ